MNSQFYTIENGLINYFLLKHDDDCGFSDENYHNAALKLVNLKTANVMSKDVFCNYMAKDVVLAAVSNVSINSEEMLCGIIVLKLKDIKEPYQGFCDDFNVPMENVKKIIIAESHDSALMTGMLWRIEQNIKYDGCNDVIAELEVNDFAMQQTFLKAGYRLKALSTHDSMDKILAYKKLSETDDINFFLKDFNEEEALLHRVLSDDSKSDEVKQMAQKTYDVSICTDYLVKMEEYCVEEKGLNLKTIAMINNTELVDIMNCGYLIAGMREGKYWCYQYADVCQNLQIKEENRQSSVA